MSQHLKQITERDVPRSSSAPPQNLDVYAKVVSVHDGDTCDLVFMRNGSFQRFKSRLLGIDTPELRAGNRALKSRDFFAWLCLGKDPGSFPRGTQPWSEYQLQNKLDNNQELVYAEFDNLGGYGRPLVTLRRPGASKSFNTLLMEYGYATKY